MRYRQICGLATVAVLVALGTPAATADDGTAGDQKPLGPFKVVLRESRPGEFYGMARVDGIKAGEQQDVAIVLMNPSGNSDISLVKPTASCGCLSVMVSEEVIPSGDSIDAILKLNLDSAKRLPVWRQRLSFDGNPITGSVVKLDVVCEVLGILAFQERQFLLQFSASQSKKNSKPLIKKLKFSATEPAKIERIAATVMPENPAIRTSIEAIDATTGYVVLEVDVNNIGDKATSFAVEIRDKDSPLVSQIAGTIAPQSPISILPSAIRLSKNDDGVLVGSVMVVRRHTDDQEEVSDNVVPIVRAVVLDRALKVREKSKNGAISRFTVSVPEDTQDELLEMGSAPITWDVNWGPDRLRTSSKCIVVGK